MAIGHAAFPILLEDRLVRSEADGKIQVIRGVASGARVLYELATGVNPFPQENAATTKNPNGDLGVCLCGPPWGPAIGHPVAWVGGILNTSVIGAKTVAVIDPGDSELVPWEFQNRYFDQLPYPRIAPYSLLSLFLRVAMDTAGSADLKVQAFKGQQFDEASARSVTTSITHTADTEIDLGLLLPVATGPNKIWVKLTNESASKTLTVISMTLNQIVKLSH